MELQCYFKSPAATYTAHNHAFLIVLVTGATVLAFHHTILITKYIPAPGDSQILTN